VGIAHRVGPSARLATLAGEIRHFLSQARRSLLWYREAGSRLRAAKAILDHGQWLPWLRDNLDNLSPLSAQRYMRIDRYWGRGIEAAWRDDPDLGVIEACAVPGRAEADLRRAEACAAADRAGRKVRPGACGVRVGDFRTAGAGVSDNSVSLIFTDPPYNKESVSLYADLARFAARVLVEGGLCFCYAPVLHLPAVLDALRGELRYVALLALVQADWGCGALHAAGLLSNWKPLVMMWQGPCRPWWQPHPDRLLHPGGRSKTYAPHEQAESEAEEIIGHFSRPGALVVDPFLGSGTTGVVCHRLGRQFCGFEIDKSVARRAAGRIRLAEAEVGGGAEAGG
jgi:hypothetical protein